MPKSRQAVLFQIHPPGCAPPAAGQITFPERQLTPLRSFGCEILLESTVCYQWTFTIQNDNLRLTDTLGCMLALWVAISRHSGLHYRFYLLSSWRYCSWNFGGCSSVTWRNFQGFAQLHCEGQDEKMYPILLFPRCLRICSALLLA